MRKKTVKRRIFLSNAWMVLTTLAILLIINIVFLKGYSEFIEYELKTSMETSAETLVEAPMRASAETLVEAPMGAFTEAVTYEESLEEVIEDFTIRRNEFMMLFLADGILCIAVLIIISHIFTRNLVNHIMEPLNALSDGAERIRNHDLAQDVEYSGDIEFENVCHTFNDMRGAILEEQEKNRKYEKARTDMIAGISHDLRTPLTAVKGTIKGLLDGVAVTPQCQKKFLETAYRRTGDMDVLLNQLFYLSKLETGNMPMDFETIEISGFIRNYVKEKQELVDNGQTEITAAVEGITGYVSADSGQLRRIFDNLLENCRKYGGVEPLKAKISLERKKTGYCICFSDNGVGVPEEKLPYIFDKFYRGDESRNKKEGNGLGLYIVKYLTEAMGGSVRAVNAGGLAVYMEFENCRQMM